MLKLQTTSLTATRLIDLQPERVRTIWSPVKHFIPQAMTPLTEMLAIHLGPRVGVPSADLTSEGLIQPIQLIQPKGDGLPIPTQR